MRVSYYPGCSLESTARDYDESLRAVFDVLGIELRELEDWNCCGASSAHITDDFLSMALPMRNLEIAEKENNDLLIPCMACFNRLKSAEKAAIGEIKTDVKTSYKGKIKIKHILDFLSEDGNLALIERFVKKPLTGLKIVSYYGCLYARPPEITDVTDYEDPRSMDKLINILGAESRPWSFKTDCCGGNLALTRIDIVKRLGNNLFDMAVEAGADCMAVACPLCHANLDTRQKEISDEYGKGYYLPVFYITELIGLSMGHSDVEKWLRRHLVDPMGLLRSVGLM